MLPSEWLLSAYSGSPLDTMLGCLLQEKHPAVGKPGSPSAIPKELWGIPWLYHPLLYTTQGFEGILICVQVSKSASSLPTPSACMVVARPPEVISSFWGCAVELTNACLGPSPAQIHRTPQWNNAGHWVLAPTASHQYHRDAQILPSPVSWASVSCLPGGRPPFQGL